jgi:hypothetical protein
MRAPKVPNHAVSPLPWRLKTRRSGGSKTPICEVVDANGKTVVDETWDEDGAVYADYKMIVEKVNSK